MDAVSLSDLLQAINGRSTAYDQLPNPIQNVSIDSRTLQPGDLFWALPGPNHDGHDHVEAALASGASACIIRETKRPIYGNKRPLITVPDTREALHNFAAWYRKKYNLTAIGITGSYGKTTTRELLYSVLATRQHGLRSEKNYNNEIGVPLSILQMNYRHEFLVAELGAAKPGDMNLLTQLTAPQIGVITGIGPAHLAGFGTIDEIINTKGELFTSLPQDGLAIVPGDHPWSQRLCRYARCRVVTTGLKTSNTYHASHIETSDHELRFQCNSQPFHLPVIGRHHINSALLAIAVAYELGYTPEQIQAGFWRFQPVAGRGQIEQTHPWTIINDTYNANPDSCKAACEMLTSWTTPGRRFLILGDMLELGPLAEHYHKELGKFAAHPKQKIDFLFATGQYAPSIVAGTRQVKASHTRAVAFKEKEELIDHIKRLVAPGDAILVKGSRGMKMETVVHALRVHDAADETSQAA